MDDTVTTGQAGGVERAGFSPAEAATILGVGRTTVYELLNRRQLRAVKAGARTIIPRAEIERFLNGGNDGSDR